MSNIDNLLSNMKKARQSQIEVDRFKFTIARPTDMDALTLGNFKTTREAIEALTHYVVDWSNVTELDLVSSGSSDTVPFHPILFAEWVQDKPELWEPLINGVMDAYSRHTSKREEAEKNSATGSKGQRAKKSA